MQVHVGEIGISGAVHRPALAMVARQTVDLRQRLQQLAVGAQDYNASRLLAQSMGIILGRSAAATRRETLRTTLHLQGDLVEHYQKSEQRVRRAKD